MQHNAHKSLKMSGEGGIRTPGTLAGTSDFESGAFNHSATSPLPAVALAKAGQSMLFSNIPP
jgi:hypothetical protein